MDKKGLEIYSDTTGNRLSGYSSTPADQNFSGYSELEKQSAKDFAAKNLKFSEEEKVKLKTAYYSPIEETLYDYNYKPLSPDSVYVGNENNEITGVYSYQSKSSIDLGEENYNTSDRENNNNYTDSAQGEDNYNTEIKIPKPEINKISSKPFDKKEKTSTQLREEGIISLAFKERQFLNHEISENFGTRNWNKEFQEILEEKDTKEKFLRLSNLEHDFVYAAKTYGRIIISENCLPVEEKTIKPVSVGGIAGGEKYIICGILFKFSIDHYGLYGGDENAMKAAAHELKGLQHFYSIQAAYKLHIPLMAFLDYRGFRLIAVSLLPIDDTTLVYGSANAGVSIHMDDPELNKLIEDASKVLNLKGHNVGFPSNQKFIYTCCDLEGHKGKDNKYYLLDFARIAPPEPPSERGSNLYRLLRLEFVRNYSKPLSSDGFSAMGKDNYSAHAAEICEAYEYLLSVVIPKFAREMAPALKKKNFETAINTIFYEAHRYGINLRHLGRIRIFVEDIKFSNFLLMEAIARTAKSYLRSLLRETSRNTGLPSDEPYRAVILYFLNTFIGKTEDSEVFWSTYMKVDIERKFPSILTDNESKGNTLREFAFNCLLEIVKRLLELMAIQINKNAIKDFAQNPMTFEFVVSDLVDIDIKASHMNLIDYADGMSLYYEALSRPSSQSEIKKRLLNLARRKLEDSIRSLSTNDLTLFQLGNVFRMMVQKHSEKNEASALFDKSVEIYKQLSQRRITSDMQLYVYLNWAKSLYKKAKIVNQSELFEKAKQKCEEGLNLMNENAELYFLLAKILINSSSFNDKKEILSLAQQKIDIGMKYILSPSPYFYYYSFKDLIQAVSDVSKKLELYKQSASLAEKALEDPAFGKKIIKSLPLDKPSKIWEAFIISESSLHLKSLLVSTYLDKLSLFSLKNAVFDPTFIPILKTFFSTFSFKSISLVSCYGLSNVDISDALSETSSSLQSLTLSDLPLQNSQLSTIFHQCTALETLDISKCSSITDEGLDQTFSKPRTNLNQLFLAGLGKLVDKNVSSIVQNFSNLKLLHLGNSNLIVDSLKYLSNCNFLEQLHIPGCSAIRDSSFKDLSIPSLQILDVVQTGLTNQFLQTVYNYFPNLVALKTPLGRIELVHRGTEPLRLNLCVSGFTGSRVYRYKTNTEEIATASEANLSSFSITLSRTSSFTKFLAASSSAKVDWQIQKGATGVFNSCFFISPEHERCSVTFSTTVQAPMAQFTPIIKIGQKSFKCNGMLNLKDQTGKFSIENVDEKKVSAQCNILQMVNILEVSPGTNVGTVLAIFQMIYSIFLAKK